MLQCQHRFASSYCAHERCRRALWVVPSTRGCLHGCRHRRSSGIRTWSTIRGIPAPGPISEGYIGYLGSDNHLRLFNGPGLYGERKTHIRLEHVEANMMARLLHLESHLHTPETNASDRCRISPKRSTGIRAPPSTQSGSIPSSASSWTS